MQYKKRKNPSLIGFYTAMGICLLAIGIAAAASYSGVKKAPAENGASASAYSRIRPEKSETTSAEEPSGNASEAWTSSRSAPSSSAPASESASRASSEAEPAPETFAAQSQAAPSSSQADLPAENREPVPSSLAEGEPLEEEVLETWTSSLTFIPPVGGEITKAFSGDELVYAETMRDYRTHNGIDLASPKGETVHAMASGVVTDIRWDDLLGNMIVIRHGDYEAAYCGLGGTALVHVGDTVTLGQDIGSVLDVPCEIIEQAHIHLEVKRNGEYIDPSELLP